MKKITKALKGLLDVIELHIPAILFAAVFVMYIIIILYRYVFNKSVYELNEICQIFYIFSATLAASFAGRSDSHVYFPLLYDRVGPKMKKFFRLTSDVAVAALCGIMYKPCWEAALWMLKKKTQVLHVSYFYLYLVFMIFITLSAVYCVLNLIKDIKTPAAQRKDGEELFVTYE